MGDLYVMCEYKNQQEKAYQIYSLFSIAENRKCGIEDIPSSIIGKKGNRLLLNRVIKPGDMVFLYTDGVTEANNNYDGFYGDDRLKNTLNKYKDQKLNIIISELTEDIYQYCGTREQFDDLTMLIMKFEGD